MGSRMQMTYSTAIVLEALSHGYNYGFDIMDATGLPSGTVYPALRRIEELGLVQSKWEKSSSAYQKGRPARKYYELTGVGAETLAVARERFRGLGRLFSDGSNEPDPVPA